MGRCAWRCFKCAHGGDTVVEEWHTRNCIGNRPITVEISKEIARDDVELCMVVQERSQSPTTSFQHMYLRSA